MDRPSILSDFLQALGVPYTRAYADERFETMTFRSIFGLTKVLQSYGIESEAYKMGDKSADLQALTPPFLAGMNSGGFVIVRNMEGGKIDLLSPFGPKTMADADFVKAWTGVVLLAFPSLDAAEPDYARHRFLEIANKAKKWVLAAAALFVFVYLFVSNGIDRHVSTILLTAVSAVGLYVSYHLLLKSLNIHSDTGDNICGIIDRTGCSTVLATSASKFFGLFGWSEVGFAYFGVTLGTLLVFPQYTGYLALVNACCCPFSFWSVWYQKYRAHAWCTMCLIVQACLWLSLACYVCGGMFAACWPLGWPFFVLCASYVIVLLGLNALMPAFDRNEKDS